MKNFVYCISLFFILFALPACERYEQVAENSPFVVICSVSDGTVADGADMLLSIAKGTVQGDCSLSVSLKEKSSGTTPPFKVLANGRTSIEDGAVWSFDDNGNAAFVITGLPAGEYRITASVSRWYHSASGSAEFEIVN